MVRSEVWTETHLLPIRLQFQREADGRLVAKLLAYLLSEILVIADSKSEALTAINEKLQLSMGKVN